MLYLVHMYYVDYADVYIAVTDLSLGYKIAIDFMGDTLKASLNSHSSLKLRYIFLSIALPVYLYLKK